MQDSTSITSSAFPQLKATTITPLFPEQEQLKCPRCDSNNTKFCYYNNYNLSQPRHYCKSCKRYWTKGGALRNIPIGGGSRKNTKKSSSSKRLLSSLSQTQLSPSDLGLGSEPESKPVPTLSPHVGTGLGLPSPAGGGGGGVGVGSFTSLLGMATGAQFGELMVEGLGSSGLWLGQGDGQGQNMRLELMEGNGGRGRGGTTSEGLSTGGESCWGGSNNSVWPDLAIYTQPGSKFQ